MPWVSKEVLEGLSLLERELAGLTAWRCKSHLNGKPAGLIMPVCPAGVPGLKFLTLGVECVVLMQGLL